MDPQLSPMPASPPDGVEAVIVPRAHDLGGFEVRRALPARERQMVGPFIVFDQMGPVNRRMNKSQQMRWSARGAHAVLAIRIAAVAKPAALPLAA
jgi:hypothetical protein